MYRFQNAVAAHKGSLVDNTACVPKKLLTELKSPLLCQHFDQILRTIST